MMLNEVKNKSISIYYRSSFIDFEKLSPRKHVNMVQNHVAVIYSS